MDFPGTNCSMWIWNYNRLLENTHLLRFPRPSSLRRTAEYASLLRTSGALHLGIFEQPERRYRSDETRIFTVTVKRYLYAD
jgi:hypothetical protein